MTCSEEPVPRNCLGCLRLPKCKHVTPQMLAERDACELHEDATAAEYMARARILEDFGPGALLPDPNPRKKVHEERYDMAASRPTLRKLAMAKGLIERTPESFELQADELIDLLSEEFPEIADLDNDEVKELLAEIEENGDDEEEKPKTRRGRRSKKDKNEDEEKPKTRRGRRRSTAKKDEEPAEEAPEEEEEEKPKTRRGRRRSAAKKEEEEKPKTRRGRRSSAKKDEEPAEEEKPKTRRGRGRRSAAKKDEEPADNKADAKEEAAKAFPTEIDLSPVIERLDTIGTELDKVSKKVASKSEKKQIAALEDKVTGLTEDVKALGTMIDGIDKVLVEIYNEGCESDEDFIESVVDFLDDAGEE